MKRLMMTLALVTLVGCGADDGKGNQTPAPAEDFTFSPAKLQDRYDLIAKGHYYFNSQTEGWASAAGLLPLNVAKGLEVSGGVLIEGETTCGGKTLKTVSQTFSLTFQGETITGSSVFVISKVSALDDVYEVVMSETVLNQLHNVSGICG